MRVIEDDGVQVDDDELVPVSGFAPPPRDGSPRGNRRRGLLLAGVLAVGIAGAGLAGIGQERRVESAEIGVRPEPEQRPVLQSPRKDEVEGRGAPVANLAPSREPTHRPRADDGRRRTRVHVPAAKPDAAKPPAVQAPPSPAPTPPVATAPPASPSSDSSAVDCEFEPTCGGGL